MIRPLSLSLARFYTTTAMLAAMVLANSGTAKADILTWEPDGVLGSPIGGTGTWDTTNLFWDNAGVLEAWDNAANDTALFSLLGATPTPATVTLGVPITAGGLTFDSSNYTLTASTLTLTGATPTITVTSAGHVARINSALAGTAGFTTAGAGQLFLGGTNTFTGVLDIGSGSYVGLTSAAALGSNAAADYTNVASGGTLNIGGMQIANGPAPTAPGEEIRIAGTGVGGIGALISTFSGGTSSLGKVVLTADATVSAGHGSSYSYNSAGAVVNGVGARIDIRLAAGVVAGQKHLDLAGNTLTKIGGDRFVLVNADTSAGNIVVNEGILGIEGSSLMTGASDGSGGAIQVNSGGKLALFAIAAAGNITRPIIVNGGTIGDVYSSSAGQTINSPISIQGALNPNFVSTAQGMTFAGVISQNLLTAATTGITQSAFTGTEIGKRGGNTVIFSNAGNSFNVPVAIYQGNLQGTFASFSGGTPVAPTLLTGNQLGTASTVKLSGGTLVLRVDGSATSNEVFTIGKTLVVDLAPSGVNLDRVGANADKNFSSAVTFAASSAANGGSIGQNQLTMTQGNNGYRMQLSGTTLNNDTVFNAGDFTFTGNTISSKKNSILHINGNSWGFIGGTHEFSALFNVGTAQLRVGAMYGTSVTSNTATAGTGTIYNGPNNSVTFRTPTNIAGGQLIDVLSQRATLATVNFEGGFTSVPANLRATGTGGLGVGGATAFGNIDLGKIGDGTFRVGVGYAGAGNGTVSGVISPGAGNTIRVGGIGTGNTLTISGTNSLTGSAALEVGSDLINGGFRITQSNAAMNGLVLVSGANNYSGGTIVNRTASLRFSNGTPGTGAVQVFGTMIAEGATGTFNNGGVNLPVTLFGGSTLRLDSSALTTDATGEVDRWENSAPIALVNSTLQLDARNHNSTTNETVGAITYAGGNLISLQRNNIGAAQIVQLQTPSLTRSGTGTLEVARSGSSGFQSNVRLIATTTMPTVTNGMVTPAISTLDASLGTNFAIFDPANGIANATYTGVLTTAFTAGLADTGKYFVDFATGNTTLTLADDPTVYALKVGGGTAGTTIATSGANDTITLRSGGLIFSGQQSTAFSNDGTRTVAFNPNLVANDGTSNIEAIINTRNAFTATISGAVTASGLTKFGAGSLILTNAANAITGTTSINQGTLELRAATNTAVAPAGTSNLRLQGGQLNVRGAAGSYTISSGVTLAQNIPIATLSSDRSDASSTGNVTFNPSVAGPGLVLEGSAGTQGQTLNVAGANYGVVFGNNATNSFTGNVTINNAINFILNNNPNISGTNPVITKAGGGLWEVGATGGTPTVAAGTQVVLNNGTLQMRSVSTFGASAESTLVLNAGTLNLRRNGDSVFGNSAGYPVVAAGNAAISADRFDGATANNLHTLGKLTINDGVLLSLSSGNNYALGFQGALFNGTAFISSTIAPGNNADSATRFLTGFNVAGGALVKTGTGHLHILNASNTYDGGTYVQQGIVRLRAAGAAGTGAVYVNPGATIDFNAANNLNTNQPLIIRGNSSLPTMVSVNVNGVTHPTGANVDFSGASTGIIGLSNGNTVYNNSIDLSTLYGGRWSFGGVGTSPYDPRYTAPALGAGADNLYRIGGGGTSMFISISDLNGTPRNNLLTGGNSVRLGWDSGTILAGNGTNHQVVIGGTHDFTGDTVIHRGMQAVIGSAAIASGSAFSSGKIDLFGVLALRSASTLQSGGTATNELTLHPGSYLNLDNNTAAMTNMPVTNVTNRIADSEAINLRGSLIEFVGNNNTASSETLGDTVFSAGARLRVIRNGTGTATLTLTSLNAGSAKGNQLLIQSSGAGTLGVSDKIIVSGGGPGVTNSMVDPKFVNITDNTFVTYDGTNGFTNIAGYKTLNAPYTPGSLLETDKVDVTTGALNLADNPTIYALRVSQSINNAGPYNQLTIRSGGLIANGATTISPNLVFNNGTQNVEAKIYTNNTVTINGAITADGVVKSGNGSLTINVPQSGHSTGWVVNSGDLNFQDPGGPGQSVAGNIITINATPSFNGVLTQTLNRPRVVFQRDFGTPELLTFTGGSIKVVNEGDVAILANNDRQIQIPSITTESTGTGASAALSVDVRFNRFRGVIPTLTLNSDTTARIYDSTNAATTSTGLWTHASVGSLAGSNVRLHKVGNRTLELSGDNSTTFTGGSINVAAGALRVLHTGALGSATTSTTIERNAALEIGVSNFSPAGTLTQTAGSIERWNVEDARGTGNYTVPAGVNLQLNTNLVSATPRIITLNGGSLEGFLYTDHVAQANQRTVGSAVTLNLASNSYVGQNILNGQGYEVGRAPTVESPFGETYTGSFLRIEGPITGTGNLTKTGLDTVTIASTGNSYGDTIVEMGVLRIAAANALPTGKTLSTRNGGTFDMYGFNQTVAGLGVANAGTNPGGTGVGVSGTISNSGITDNTLTVNNAANFTYNGVIERNIALTKQGAGDLTLGAANTYVGATTVSEGTLIVSGSIAGSATTVNGGTLKGTGTVGALTLAAGGTLAPGNSPGILNAGSTDFGGGTFALELNGTVLGTDYDQLNVTGSVAFSANTPLTISLGFDPADDGSQLFTIVANDGLESINTGGGLFSFGGNPLTEGAQFDTGSQLFSISYAGGSDNNDVVLTAVPEPGSATVLIAGLVSLAGLKRMRRRKS